MYHLNEGDAPLVAVGFVVCLMFVLIESCDYILYIM